MKDPRHAIPPTPEALNRVTEFAERRLTAAEFNDYVNAPMSDQELEEILASVAWFRKRYPTPAERMAAARRACTAWTRPRG